jgi:hypothetical protein
MGHVSSFLVKNFSIPFLTKHVPSTMTGNTIDIVLIALITHNDARQRI